MSNGPRFFWIFLLMKILFIHGGNTLCNNKKIIYSGVLEEEKQMIVDSHNKLRQLVALGQIGNQPPASNMMQLKWDESLAQRAQYWAAACASYVHDPGRHKGEFFVGQNVATRWTTKVPTTFYDMSADWINDAISKWFDEYSAYRFNSPPDPRTGHYSQLVWAETATVGCGFVYYLDGRKQYTKKYVCNYGPSGNIVGESPYKKGFPNCFNNGLIDSKSYAGLCEAAPISYTFNPKNYYNLNANKVSYTSGFLFNY